MSGKKKDVSISDRQGSRPKREAAVLTKDKAAGNRLCSFNSLFLIHMMNGYMEKHRIPGVTAELPSYPMGRNDHFVSVTPVAAEHQPV